MIRGLSIALVLIGCLLAAPGVVAQSPAGGGTAQAEKNKPSSDGQKPGAVPQSGANPFPEDISTVPVMPSEKSPALPEGTKYETRDGDVSASAALPTEDTDPVRSPEDPTPAAGNTSDGDSSSSLKNIENLLPVPDTDEPGKKRKHAPKEEPVHQETSKSDIDVGSYYLDRKNWSAALSRFQSALVLDPEDPEVYWGMAEAERNLGQFANAREHYEKLLEYDPDGKHGKQARKVLKEPALAAAQNPGQGQSPSASPQ
jgi:hypothetical protein